MAATLEELAGLIDGTVCGDRRCVISRVATLQSSGPGDISFLANRRYRKALSSTKASAVIIAEADREYCPVNALVVKDPYLAYARVASYLNPPRRYRHGRHLTASISARSRIQESAWVGPNCVIEEDVEIGADVVVGPNCIVQRHCIIGAGSRLAANVTICHGVTIGRNVIIHPGVVIGSDGFGFAREGDAWIKVPQLGGVRIGDNVEIGANTTIDRGTLEDTVIEEGVKLDNQIQVAHNVRIGAHTAIAGCTGIAGSARIGARCSIGGGVGIVGHTEIADDVHITGMSFVANSIKEPGVYSSGTPLEPTREWRKNYVRFHQLDDMARRLRMLELAIKDLVER